MAKASKTKGKAGELELIHVLRDHLGLELTRRLSQTQEGGHDLDGWDGVHVEVKRYASATQGRIREWWQQTLSQCPGDETPLLAYRADKQDWRFVIRPTDWGGPVAEPAQVDIEGLVAWVLGIPRRG